ncbi:MAG: hypothetical protein QME58_02820 [Bacteroidota bacterium]|nr:hypothetical protein [Bacteroidota bacterium]
MQLESKQYSINAINYIKNNFDLSEEQIKLLFDIPDRFWKKFLQAVEAASNRYYMINIKFDGLLVGKPKPTIIFTNEYKIRRSDKSYEHKIIIDISI